MLEYHTATLPSGLRIVQQFNDSPVAFCGFMVDCGTRNEDGPAEFGLAHFIEHILFKGTRKRDAWHINQRMESVGGELNAYTTKEDTTFYCTFLSEDFPRACELLCDLLFNATAPQHELVKEQEVVIDEIVSYRDNPSELIYDVFENQLFAGTPLGHNILGSEQTVRSFDHDRCLGFIRRNYRPECMVFFCYGNIPWPKVLASVEKNARPASPSIADLAQAAPSGLAPIEAETTETPYHQSHCMLGCRTYPYGHPNAAALALINNILGGPSMNSRLNQQLREKNGLVYTVESSVTPFTDTGYFSIYFGCDHEDRDRCLRLCRRELQRIATQPLSPRQLQSAQKQFLGQLGIGQANLENNALALAKRILRFGRIESLEETAARIQAVTSAQLQQVASELFTDDRLLTVVLK